MSSPSDRRRTRRSTATATSTGSVVRLPHSTLGIALGLAGAGNAWNLAHIKFGAPAAIAELLFGLSAAWWLLVTLARLPVTGRRLSAIREDSRHPVNGPFVAYIPVVALLLTGHYAPLLSPPVVNALIAVWVALLALVCARLVAHWLSGAVDTVYVHPGYALPVMAGPFIATIVMAAAGHRQLAIAAAAVGLFFWLTLGTVITTRLMHGPELPASLAPTLAVLATPPVTAGLAWFSITGGAVDEVQYALGGLVVVFVLTQLFMLRRYLKGPFHLGWWALAFPAGALASYMLRWAVSAPGQLTSVAAISALAVASIVLLGLLAATLALVVRPLLNPRSRQDESRRV